MVGAGDLGQPISVADPSNALTNAAQATGPVVFKLAQNTSAQNSIAVAIARAAGHQKSVTATQISSMALRRGVARGTFDAKAFILLQNASRSRSVAWKFTNIVPARNCADLLLGGSQTGYRERGEADGDGN